MATITEFKFFKALRGRTIFQTPIEEVKRQYHKLALLHHPDRGGNLEDMQRVNAEWDVLRKRCYNIHESASGEVYTNEQQDAPDEVTNRFAEIIEQLIHMDGLTVEVCGSWLWVGGNTKEHKDALKAMGMRWASKKKMWFMKPDNWKRRTRRELSMSEIRDTFGSISYQVEGRKALTA